MTKLKVLVMISDKSSVILRSALPAFPYHRTITNWEKGESKHALPRKQVKSASRTFQTAAHTASRDSVTHSEEKMSVFFCVHKLTDSPDWLVSLCLAVKRQ